MVHCVSMEEPLDPAIRDDALRASRAALLRPRAPVSDLPARFLLVDVARQRLVLFEEGQPKLQSPISTAARGVSGEADSFGTPPGWHRIQARIGAGAPLGTVFEERKATGRIWRGEAMEDDLILTRIITLEGLEDAVNRGPGCDSLERAIYIHGTNHEDALGRPASHGCIRMANADIARLFDRVGDGDPVVIVEGIQRDLA